MKKSFTWLFSLVVLLGSVCLSGIAEASAPAPGYVVGVWPEGATAYTETTDKAMVIYSEDVVASTGAIRLSDNSGVIAVIYATDPKVSVAKGDTVVIDLSGSLKELTEYTITVDANAFKPADGEPASFTSEATWLWMTGDYSAPTLASVVPVKGAVVDNQTTYSLQMVFEDASVVEKGTGNVSLYKADGNIWSLIDVTSGSLTGSGPYTLTFSSPRPLEDNTEYYVTVDAGAVTDDGKRADDKKNSYAGLTDKTVWSFTTKDFSVPGYASGYPKIGTVGNTSAEVLIKAAEAGTAYAVAVNNNAGNPGITAIKAGGSVTVANTDTEYKITLTQNLGVASTSEDFDVYVVMENADVDAVAGDAVKLDVTTTENTAPTLSGVEYFKGTTSATTGSVLSNVVSTAARVNQMIDNIVLTFSEEVKIGSGNVIIKKASDNSDFLTVAAASLSVDGTKVKVPVSGLGNNTQYYVWIPNTLVLDKYDNKYAGISSTGGWKFATDDTVAPTLTYTPADGAVNIAEDEKIVIKFNELVKPKISYTLDDAFTLTQDGLPTAFNATTSTNGGLYTTITITPISNFNSSAVVTLAIVANILEDYGGNVVDPAGQGISFVIEDTASPVVTWDLPSKPADELVVKFDEPVYLTGGGEITNDNLFSILTLKNDNANGTNVTYTATISADKKKITIVPSTAWGSENSYFVAVTQNLEDAEENGFDGANRTQIFTIDDVTPATVDLSSVDGKTIATTDPVTLVFKEGSAIEERTSLYYDGSWNNYSVASDMENVIILKEGSANGADVAFSVSSVDDATFAISASLEGNKTYYIGVGASTKGADGNINEPKFVTFNTKYEGVPTVVSLSPADNAIEVDRTSDFVITFNTDVEVSSGYATGQIQITDGIAPIDIPEIDIHVSGKVVTIDPTANLANDNAYEIIVNAGVFENKNKATSVNTAINSGAWSFLTKDTQVELTDLSADEATAGISDNLVMTFNEKVTLGTGYVDIKVAGTDALVERINISSTQVTLSDGGKKVTINPTNDFLYNTSYYVEVSAGALVDHVSNPSDAIAGKGTTGLSDWTFTTANPDLEIVKITPADGSDKIGANEALVIEFNREIKVGTGSVGYVEWDGSTQQIQSYPIGSTNISISGKVLTVTHTDKPFPNNSEIFVYLEAGAIVASSDATKANTLLDRTNYTATTYITEPVSFYTGDVNPPVPTFDPAAFNASSPVYVSVNDDIVITFDEDIYNADSSPITDINVTNGGGLFTVSGTISGAIDFTGSISGRVVTLQPTSPFEEYEDVTVTLVQNKIEDVNGETIISNITSTFRTEDTSAPTVTAFTLTGDDEKIIVPVITVGDGLGIGNNKFYYLVREKSTAAAPTVAEIKAANSKDATGGTISSFEVKSLSPSTTYQFYYLADDKVGNESTVAVVEAETDDTVAPLLVSTDPVSDEMDVDVTSANGGSIVVKLTFNEDVLVGTGAITVRDYATQGLLASLTQSNLAAVTGDSKSINLTISSFGANEDAEKIYVEIEGAAIKDLAGNSFGGVFGKDSIVFTTEDNLAPTVDAAKSTNGNISLSSDLKVVFSENVVAGTGKATLYKGSVVSVSNAVEVFNATSATFSGNTATINPSANLENGQDYILAVGAGFAKDVSSNANASVATDGSMYQHVVFTGTSNPAPTVTFSPAGGSIALNPTSFNQVIVSFSEDIYLTIAGYSKPLALLTQADLLAHINFVDGDGAAIAISEVTKTGGDQFTIKFDSDDIKANATYALTISGFEDKDAQVMVNAVADFTTDDEVPPTITFAPANDAKNVALAANLTLTFSENVYAEVISANDNVFAFVDNSNVETFVYLRTGSHTGTNVPFSASISGHVITVNPTSDLKSGTEYYYGLDKAVYDLNNTAITPGTAGAMASFTAIDTEAPVLYTDNVTATYFNPLGSSVSANEKMWVKFKEPIVVSTGSVVIRREDGTIFETVAPSGLAVDASDNTKLNITHTNFEPMTNYFVELQASVVVDKAGNANAAYSDAVDGWKFTTNDTYDLEVASTSPYGDNTARTVTIEVGFNKAPVPVAGKYLAIYKADGTAVYQKATTAMVVSGNTASIGGIELEADQAYYARIEKDGFTDANGNSFAGILDNSWVFSTVDNIAPKVVALTPEDNDIAVDPTTSFSIKFDRDIVAGTGMIAVRSSANGDLVEEVDVTTATISDSTLTWDLTAALAPSTGYYVIVPAGAVMNTEVTADAFTGILNTYDWNFTTSDVVMPKLTAWTPQGTIVNNHPTFEMTFAADIMYAQAGNLYVTEEGADTPALTIPITSDMVSGTTVTVDYDYNAVGGLEVSTTYVVTVDADVLENAEGNAFGGVSGTAWTFTTGPDVPDGTEPEVEAVDFKIYPNPFSDQILIDNNDKLTRVIVHNIAGQKVIDVEYPEHTISTSKLVSGVYLISLINEDGIAKTERMVKR